jgi:2-dehydro-3-deoxygluconokinase
VTAVSSGAPVIGLGESLLRLSAPGRQRLDHAQQLEVHVGGAEMNALIAGAALGLRATWVTRLADNPLGRRIAAHAVAHGVEAIVDWDADARAPLYFVEHGVVPRPSEVLYDRGATAMRGLTETTFDWAELLEGHVAALSGGITCALGEGPTAAVRALFAHARDSGARTVFDVNHRSRLWSWEIAAPVMRHVLQDVDVLLASRHDLERILDRDEPAPVDLARGALDAFGHTLVVLRETAPTPAGRIEVSVTAVTAGDELTSPAYEADVVDAFGAGDAAVGALLAALLSGEDVATAVDRAAWASAFQHTTPGDAWQGRPADLTQRDMARRVLR